MRNVHAAIERFRIDARLTEASTAEELDRALPQLAKEAVQALVVLTTGGVFNAERQRILQFARSQRWPVISLAGWVRQALCSVTAPIFPPFTAALRIMSIGY